MKPDEVPAVFGSRVKDARVARGWSQSDLAEHLGRVLEAEVNPVTVTRIEGGKRPVPLQEAVALAQIFGTTVGELLTPTDDMTHIEAGRLVTRWATRKGVMQDAWTQLARYLATHPETADTIFGALAKYGQADQFPQLRTLATSVERGDDGEHREAT